MDPETDKKISSLPLEQRADFWIRLGDVLHDRYWFEIHQMDYADPNVCRIKEILFREEYSKYLTGNNPSSEESNLT